MKYIYLFVFIFIFSAKNVHANSFYNRQNLYQYNSYTISSNLYKSIASKDVDMSLRAKRLRIAGLTLTGLGVSGILITTPFVVIAKRNSIGYISDNASTLIGISGYVPATALLVTGIPMSIVGYKRVKTAREF